MMFRKNRIITVILFILFFLLGYYRISDKEGESEAGDSPKLTHTEAEIEKQRDRVRQLLMMPNTKETGNEALEIGKKLKEKELKNDADMIHVIMKYQVEAYAFLKAASVAESVSPDKPDTITYANQAIDSAQKSLRVIYVEIRGAESLIGYAKTNKHQKNIYQRIDYYNGRKDISYLILAASFSIKARSGEAAFGAVRYNIRSYALGF